MRAKTFYVEQLGEIDFIRNKRAKYLRITVKPCGKVRVTLPARCSYKEAMGFVLQKIDRISECIGNINAKKQVFNENSVFKIGNHRLEISGYSGQRCKFVLKDGLLRFYYPETKPVEDIHVQNEIRKALIHLLRLEARLYLPERVEQIAGKYNFKYKKVFVKNLKTRWGSCSSVNNINLNLHLMRLPEHLSDYVIIHELAHTREKNHGKGFRTLLDSFVGDSVKLDRELKNYSTQL